MSAATTRSCPICRKPRSEKHAPFCSDRCRDRDLLRWFGQGYAIPGRAADDPGRTAERPENDDSDGA